MIFELHFPLSESDVLLAAWECLDDISFDNFKNKIQSTCSKYSQTFQALHEPTGNSLFIISSCQDDFYSIQKIMNNFATNNNVNIIVE